MIQLQLFDDHISKVPNVYVDFTVCNLIRPAGMLTRKPIIDRSFDHSPVKKAISECIPKWSNMFDSNCHELREIKHLR
jgi:hypothetical protein